MDDQNHADTIEDQAARADCFMLCDYARAENSKLYILGGGWDEIVPQSLPLEYKAYLAIKLVVLWRVNAGPFAAEVRAELVDDDGQTLGDPVFETNIMAGPVNLSLEEIEGFRRLKIALFMANEANMTLTRPGLFSIRLLVNDEVIATTEFSVTPPPDPDFMTLPPEFVTADE